MRYGDTRGYKRLHWLLASAKEYIRHMKAEEGSVTANAGMAALRELDEAMVVLECDARFEVLTKSGIKRATKAAS